MSIQAECDLLLMLHVTAQSDVDTVEARSLNMPQIDSINIHVGCNIKTNTCFLFTSITFPSSQCAACHDPHAETEGQLHKCARLKSPLAYNCFWFLLEFVKNKLIDSHLYGTTSPPISIRRGGTVARRSLGGGGVFFRDRLSAQLSVRMVSSSSGLRRVGLLPPAAAISACTAASQANVSRAAGTWGNTHTRHDLIIY